MVVLHYTEMKPVETAIARLCDKSAEVSAHYLITDAGEVIGLVPEDKRAWHAGKSVWRGIDDVNSASIGIELDHPGHGSGTQGYSEAQIDALVVLLRGIVARHAIKLDNVVGHSDVAPERKVDPGEFFPWARLAAEGLCASQPTLSTDFEAVRSEDAFATGLARYGYSISDRTRAIAAFQRRWRPARVDGCIDDECAAILAALLN